MSFKELPILIPYKSKYMSFTHWLLDTAHDQADEWQGQKQLS